MKNIFGFEVQLAIKYFVNASPVSYEQKPEAREKPAVLIKNHQNHAISSFSTCRTALVFCNFFAVNWYRYKDFEKTRRRA